MVPHLATILVLAGGLAVAGVRASPLRVPAQAEVGPDGALHYTVPIRVPPGIADLAPRLSLAYSSQGGNGLAGLGWSLEGLGAVTRCPRTKAQDNERGAVNFDARDRFCLDGQRLVQVAGGAYGSDGAEYRTERDSQMRVVSYGAAGGGPARFRAWTKSGLVMDFGGPYDATIEAHGKDAVRVWALSRLQDAKGNYLTASYARDTANGAFYPQRIAYTGNAGTGALPAQAVEFIYDASRLDQDPGYHAGSLVKTTQRLKQVKTLSAGALVETTELFYAADVAGKPSRVNGIRRCSATGDCLPNVVLTWADWNPDPAVTGVEGGDWDLEQVAIVTGDFNGDGRTDFIRQGSGGWQGRASVYLSQPDGTFMPVDFADTWNKESVVLTPGDFDGDGKTDFFRQAPRDWGGHGSLHLSNGDGNFTATDLGAGWDSESVQLTVGDFDGDGRTDYLRQVTTSWGGGAVLYLSTGAVITLGTDWSKEVAHLTAADFNGDGKTDVLRQMVGGWGGTGWVHLSKGDGTFEVASLADRYDLEAVNIVAGDFNGDGKADFIRRSVKGWGSSGFVHLSKGDGTFTTAPLAGTWDVETVGLTLGDFNGDGRTDFIQQFVTGWGGNALLHLAKGDGTFASTTLAGPWDREALGLTTGDFDGDGRTDFIRQGIRTWGGRAEHWRAGPSLGAVNVITGIANGGLQHTIGYRPLTDATVYTRTTTSLPGALLVQAPLFVVASVETSNGLGGLNAVRHTYGDLAVEPASGRGLLGFRWCKAYDEASAMEVARTYRQDHPYTGLVEKVEQRYRGSAGDVLLARTTSTYQQAPGSAAPAVFVFASQVAEEGWDLAGTPFPTTTTTYVYGQAPQYGDATRISVSTSDGAMKVVTNEYDAAVTAGSAWILGRLKRATVQSSKP